MDRRIHFGYLICQLDKTALLSLPEIFFIEGSVRLPRKKSEKVNADHFLSGFQVPKDSFDEWFEAGNTL